MYLQVEIFQKVHKEIVLIFYTHKGEDHKYENSVKVRKNRKYFIKTFRFLLTFRYLHTVGTKFHVF